MSDSETTTIIADTDCNAISDDLMCLACAYNLRGLNRSGGCPECGLSISKTIIARHGMTKRELAVLAYRVAALWVALLQFHPRTLSYILDPNNRISTLLRTGIILILLALIWWKAGWLARKTVAHDGPISLNGTMSPKLILSLAFVIIGMICLIRGIYYMSCAVGARLNGQNYVYVFTWVLGGAVNLIMGVLMIVGAGRIAAFVRWLRTAGTNHPFDWTDEA